MIKCKMKAVALVRDSEGKPKFDDINNIPEDLWNQLTPVEQEEIRNGRNTSRNDS